MKSINIGLIGFGTVGSGLYYLLQNNSDIIKERTNINLKIKAICDLETEKIKKNTKNIHITNDWKEIVNDNEIDIIVELIGGLDPAKSIIIESLKNNKGVVTANKKLLAENGTEIFSSAGSRLGFEAAIGGGIPCVLALEKGLIGNRIKSILGILNGTTNYILTKMESTRMSFEEALKNAQEKGFAEADPTADIEGFDAGHKIALLSMLAFNKNIDFNSIPIEGISKINKIDLSFARDMGYVIKLLGISKIIDGTIDIRVHPTMIPGSHPLASVKNEYNAVMYDCDMTDPIILYGKGAGSNPTASAVLSDIIQLTERSDQEDKIIKSKPEAEFILPENRMSRYYIRIHTCDKPGILSKISGVLGNHNISIASVIQREIDHNDDDKYIPLIIMTHKAQEKGIINASKEINNFDFVGSEVSIIRVEDSLD